MGSPAIFNGKFTKLLTQNGILNSNGSINQNDGPRNYIAYSQFEQNNTTGWSLGTIGTLTNGLPTGSPTFGSGASGSLSISAIANPLRGNYSMAMISSAATTAGNMLASDALAIDTADQAKVLSFKFYYSVPVNPTNGNFSGTSSNSFGVAVYDVTNSVFLGVQGAFGMTQSSGVGIASGTFQTNSNTASIRFIVYNVNATSGAITLYFDDFFVGPQQVNIGPVVTDWQSYTPTGSWTSNTTYTGLWRRVGKQIEVQANLTLSGAPNAASLTISIPSGYSIDTSNMVNGTSQDQWVGGGAGIRTGTAHLVLSAVYNNTTSIQVGYQNSILGQFANVTNTAPYTFGNGDTIQVTFKVPILGWSSNVQMSSDSYQGVVSFRVGQSLTTALNTSPTKIPFTAAATFDTTGSYSPTNNNFTIPVSGYYEVGFGAVMFANANGQVATLGVYKNASQVDTTSFNMITTGNNYYFNATKIIQANAGDVIDIRAFVNTSTSALAADANANFFAVKRISGPSVLAATETYAASYSASSGQALNNNVTSFIDFPTKSYDSSGMYAAPTGAYSAASGSWATTQPTWTVPLSGKYYVFAVVGIGMAASGTGQYREITIYKNGVQIKEIQASETSAGAYNNSVLISSVIQCNTNDYIQIKATQTTGANKTLVANAIDNYLDIVRVGN
jgi:hypothetical protein